MGRRLHCVSRLACYVQSYMKHEESQEVSVFRLRVKIERRPDAPPLWSVEFLSGGGGGRLVDGDGVLHGAGGGVLRGG